MQLNTPPRERKPIDPELRQYLDALAKQTSTAPMTDEMQVRFRRMVIMKALENRGPIPGLPNRVETQDVEISNNLTARLYIPPRITARPSVPLPVLVYLHGGGWVVGSIATHDPFCRLLSERAGIIIASIEYRLAPEHPYPAALEDTTAALLWASANAGHWGGDSARLALGGDSAGGNLAAVTANRLSNAAEAPMLPGGHPLRALLLLYPVTDHPSAHHPSYEENATGFALESTVMRWYWQQYASNVSPDDPNISPLRLRDTPAVLPTLVATAEYDPLRDEGLAYAHKLQLANVPVTHLHAPDMTHNFPAFPGTVQRFPQCEAALTQIADWLRLTLAPPSAR